MNLRLGRVAAVHPEDNSVDLVMVDNGMRMPGVQVLSMSASTNSGKHDLRDPTKPESGDEWSLGEETDCDMMAVTGVVGGQLVALGFLFPQVSQMLFKDRNRKVERHASGVYSTIDGAGNMEVCHPSGFYMRVGVGSAHEDLTGKDADGRWKIPPKPANVDFHLAMGGNVMSINVKPSGAITVNTNSTTTVNSAGLATVVAPAVLVDSPQSTFTGAVLVKGLFTYQAGMAGSGAGPGGKAASITGSLETVGGDIQADNISLKNHGHIEAGDGNRVGNAVP